MKKLIITNHIYMILLGLCISPLSVLANTIVDIQTNKGLITVELADDVVPITVNNFLTYVDEGFYTETVFHRVINGFMIQGGGFNAALEVQDIRAPITLESNIGLSNRRGTIAMARRTSPDSASSQFFINTEDNLFLDYQNIASPGYAVFGEVISGMSIVDAISKLETGALAATSGNFANIPLEPVLIEAIRLRSGQLVFTAMQKTYSVGDSIVVSLEETMDRLSVLDLWVAILTEDGNLLYITEQGFSLMPGVFMTNVSTDDTQHRVFELTVPEGLTGHFTLFAIFNNSGDGIADLNQSLRSNIAAISVDLVP